MAWGPYYGRRCSKIVPPNATVEREVQSVLEDYPILLDGRMPYIATVRDDMKLLFNHPGMTLREWATFHKAELIRAAVGKAVVR
jgi:hypothetical protein